MKWEEAKHLIKSGDLIFVSHQEWDTISDIESHIVRMATESEFSHVCVAYEYDGGACTIESIVPAVTVSCLDKYIENGFYWVHIPDKPMTKDEEGYGLSKLGQAYSKIEAIEGYFDLIEIGGSQSWFCAELTIAMRRLSGLDLGTHCTPAAIAKKILEKGYTMHFIKKDCDE